MQSEIIILILISLYSEVTSTYCGIPVRCSCFDKLISCRDSMINQIPFFTSRNSKRVVQLDLSINGISHPRGDLSKECWPNLQIIDLRKNPIICTSNITVLMSRFNTVYTDECSGIFIFFSKKIYKDKYILFLFYVLYKQVSMKIWKFIFI